MLPEWQLYRRLVFWLYLLLLHTYSAFFLVLLSELQLRLLLFLLVSLLSFRRSKKRAWASTRWRPRVTGMEEIQETSQWGDVKAGESHNYLSGTTFQQSHRKSVKLIN